MARSWFVDLIEGSYVPGWFFETFHVALYFKRETSLQWAGCKQARPSVCFVRFSAQAPINGPVLFPRKPVTVGFHKNSLQRPKGLQPNHHTSSSTGPWYLDIMYPTVINRLYIYIIM